MRKQIIWVFFFCCLFWVFSCTGNEKKLNWDELIQKYSQKKEDSLHLAAALFLKGNTNDIISDNIIFYNKETGKAQDFRIDTISSEASLLHLLDQQNLNYKTETVSDGDILSNELLEKNIDQAINAWKKYPWNSNVSRQQFLEYLLPYKILDEYPDDWRVYFSEKYRACIDSLVQVRATPHTVYERLILKDAVQWFAYGDHFVSLTNAPSFRELMCSKMGECSRFARLYTYILRAAGIPATIDYVPKWGSGNAGHAEVVFVDSTGSMNTYEKKRLGHSAKVFRITIRNKHQWTDSIAPILAGYDFQPTFLKNNHWEDVTHEHNPTADVEYIFPDSLSLPFAYICVYNYGKWEPVFWGQCKNGKTVFKNMGCHMLYRVALPDKNAGYKPVGNVFKLDSMGRLLCIRFNTRKVLTLAANKLNSGAHSWVKCGENYTLYYLDKESQWNPVGSKTCLKDSVLRFSKVPADALYRLVKDNGNRRLERIFSYENNKQVWW